MRPNLLSLAIYWQYGREPLRLNMSLATYVWAGGPLLAMTRRPT